MPLKEGKTREYPNHFSRFDIYGLLSYYSGFGRCDDDFTDRLSRHYSVLIFSVFLLIVSSVQFVGTPISCFTPASFTTAHITYADFVCWISDTYFVPIDAEIPDTHELSDVRPGSHVIRFYQYVPWILMVQTCGFFLPGFLWRSGSSRLGLSLQKQIDQLKLGRRSYADPPFYRRQLIRNVAARLDQYFRLQRCYALPRITLFYLFIKLLYLMNILLQLYILYYLMDFDFNVRNLLERFLIYSNTVRSSSFQFPTNVLCDFIVRFLGNNKHRHTVQCVLPINIFNEKIFIFSYFWLLFLLICTAYNLFIQWIFFLLFHRRVIDTRQRRQRRFLSKSSGNVDQDEDDDEEESDVRRRLDYQPISKNFSQHYLRSDGLVLMRLFDMNTDLVTMNDLMDDLWDFYRMNPF